MKAGDVEVILSGLMPGIAEFAEAEVAEAVRRGTQALSEQISATAAAVESRLNAVERALEAAPAPKDGEDGKSVTLDELRPLVHEVVANKAAEALEPRLAALEAREAFTADQARAMLDEAVAALPVPQDGASVTLDDVRPLIEEAVKAIPAPKDGDHGTSVSVADVLPALTEQVAAHLAALPIPKDGQSVTVAEVVEAMQAPLEALHAKWALDFERRAADTLQRACERIPKPKDGLDGMGFDDIEVTHDGERRFCIRMVRGEQVKEFPFRVPALIDRGVFKEGTTFETGDGVTFGGNFWIAQKDDPEGKPGLSDDWRLAVRRGRDSK